MPWPPVKPSRWRRLLAKGREWIRTAGAGCPDSSGEASEEHPRSRVGRPRERRDAHPEPSPVRRFVTTTLAASELTIRDIDGLAAGAGEDLAIADDFASRVVTVRRGAQFDCS